MTGNGELVHRTLEAEILKLDPQLKSLKRINILIIEKVILNLLDTNSKRIRDISEPVVETTEDVRVALEELILEGLVESSKTKKDHIKL